MALGLLALALPTLVNCDIISYLRRAFRVPEDALGQNQYQYTPPNPTRIYHHRENSRDISRVQISEKTRFHPENRPGIYHTSFRGTTIIIYNHRNVESVGKLHASTYCYFSEINTNTCRWEDLRLNSHQSVIINIITVIIIPNSVTVQSGIMHLFQSIMPV